MLENYRHCLSAADAELVIGGYWSQSPHHSGHLSYYLIRDRAGVWVMTSRSSAGRRIVAVCADARATDTPSAIARAMYDAVIADGGAEIEDEIEEGLIADE